MRINKIKTSWERVNNSKFYFPITFALSTGSIILAYIPIIQKAIKDGDIQSILSVAVLIIFFSIIGFYFSRSDIKKRPPKKGIFQGPNELGDDEVWPRYDEADSLYNIIKKTSFKPILLVGPSGVGKSVLLKREVWEKRFEKANKWKGIFIDDYTDFQSILFQALFEDNRKLIPEKFLSEGKSEKIDTKCNLLISFDQFEKFLFEYPEKDTNSIQMRTWFNKFITNAKEFSNIRIVITLRKEWYFDLKILLNFIPEETFPISGFKTKTQSGELYKRLLLVTRNEEAAIAVFDSLMIDEEILPIEAQIVGFMLENNGNKEEINRERYFKEFGGKEGLIQQYFADYIDASPNRNISLKVLTTLSVQTSLRSQHSQSEIANIVHETIEDVSESLSFMCKHKLTEGNLRYAMAHDYLAEKFHEYSGGELDPEERDNILFFWDEMRSQSKSPHLKPIIMTGQYLVKSDQKPREKRALIFGQIPAYFAYLFILFRIFSPLFGMNWSWFNPHSSYQFQLSFLDIFYLPVGVSHFAWTIYTTSFFKNFLVDLIESRRSRLFSNFIPVFSTLLVVICGLKPHFWIFLIGLGGFPVGIKMYLLSKTKGLPKVSSGFFEKTGLSTIINVTVTALLGLVLIYFTHTDFMIKNLNVINLFLCGIMLYFMLLVKSRHSNQSATAKMKGLIDRGRVREWKSKFI